MHLFLGSTCQKYISKLTKVALAKQKNCMRKFDDNFVEYRFVKKSIVSQFHFLY